MNKGESYAAGPSEPPVRDITIGEALAEVAAACPERVALIAGVADPAERRQWTYGELYHESHSGARALLARFSPGERVAVWAPNIPERILMEYGCALAGVTLVTVKPYFQSDELAYLLKQSSSAGIFLMREFLGNPMWQHM